MATAKIKLPETWEEFCEATGRDPLRLPDTSVYEEKDKRQAISNFKMNLVIPYCNGKKLNYADRNEIKYEIWWDVVVDESQPSGLGLRYYYYGFWGTFTFCGPRFAFVSIAVAKHIAKYFLQDMIDLLT